ncbi:MAG: hypothetical protein KatS3mg110_3726 [Pirellulaceae bacterium]|nr:MAG: hypothetical protein KatS3mg110_3726 [Pirellulaceae bacterium]
MAFSDADLREFLNRLQGDPVACQQLRNLLRDPVLERLSSEVAALALAQRQTEERLGALAERMEQLAEAQRQTDERLGRLSERMDQLAEAQRRTEERLSEFERRTEERFALLTERVDQLAEAQRRTEEQLARLTERVDQLAEAQRQTEERLAEFERRTEERFALLAQRMEELAEAQRQTEERLAALIERVDRIDDRVGELVGESLERRYRDRAAAYFGQVLRRSRVVDNLVLEEALEDHLSAEEVCDILRTDVIVSGKPRNRPEVEEVWVAVEVSSVIDTTDVERVVRRSRLLARSGRPVVPVVAGKEITRAADEAARTEKVAVVRDGRISNWGEALTAALASN